MKISVTTLPAASPSPKPGRRPASQRGMMLIECVAYVAVFFMLLGAAFTIFYNCWDSSKGLRRNTDDIVGAVRAGERWRADLRAATAPPRTENSPQGQLLLIPHSTGNVAYRFDAGTLWRRGRGDTPWAPVLDRVKSSRMQPDKRQRITAWRWELELASRRKDAKVVPLFTFEAVPQPVD